MAKFVSSKASLVLSENFCYSFMSSRTNLQIHFFSQPNQFVQDYTALTGIPISCKRKLIMTSEYLLEVTLRKIPYPTFLRLDIH